MKKIFTTLLMMGVALVTWGLSPAPDPTEGPEPHFDPATGVLTVRYNQYVNKGKSAENIVKSDWRGNVKKLVLIGEYTNEDCNVIDGIVNKAVGGDGSTKTLYLDLEGCTGFFCKVQPDNDDWTSGNYEYYYTNNMSTRNVEKKSFLFDNGRLYTGSYDEEIVEGNTVYSYSQWIEKNGNVYTGTPEEGTNAETGEKEYFYYEWLCDGNVPAQYSNEAGWVEQCKNGGSPGDNGGSWDGDTYTFIMWGQQHQITRIKHTVESVKTILTQADRWYYIKNNNNGSTQTILVDDDDVTVTDATHGTIPMHDPNGIQFFQTFNSKKFLNGITFPCGDDFLAIPELFLKDADTNNSAENKITTVSFGENSKLQWIGKAAFMNLSKLGNVTFPQTLKVIGIDAFYACQSITTVDLRIRDLVKVDAAAFNMKEDYEGEDPWDGIKPLKNQLTTVYLPEEDNETLQFFGNQVFSSSRITELDFSHCLGIKHFGYDGEYYFNEVVPSEVDNTTRTFTWHRFLTKVTLPPNLLHVGDECFFKCQALHELVFKGKADYKKENCPTTNELKNPLTIGVKACEDTPLAILTLSDNVTEIRSCAFSRTSLTEVRIPASVQVIGYQAFQDQTDAEGNMTLKTVIFDEIDNVNCAPCKHAQTLVKEEAFLENTAISDVYVNTVVDINCENHGFPFEITFAQGDASAAATGQAAILHFPAGHEAHYTNLNHGLDNETASDAGLFQAWLVAHYNAAQRQPEGYGWYEFVNTASKSTDPKNPDPTYDPEEGDDMPLILRTFSDPTYARIVPDGLRAYVVNKVEKTAKNYQLTLQRIPVIPAQTGVVLFGQPNSKNESGQYILAMSAVGYLPNNGQPLRRDYWDILPTEVTPAQAKKGITEPDCVRLKNYLMPIINNANIRTVTDGVESFEVKDLTTVNPYEPYKTGDPVEWRNFALNRMDQTANLQSKFKDFSASAENYAGFFRILPGKWPVGYAYLHLNTEEYDSATGAECVVTADGDYFMEENVDGPYDPRNNVKLNWWKNNNTWDNMIDGWGTRDEKFDEPGAIQFLGELEDTDGIVKLVIPEDKIGEIFSISGMKVTNPSKGIYIQNGKKIIIK